MTEFTSYEHGVPSWVDLTSPDVEASKAFYTSLFGWDATDQFDDEDHFVYTMFTKDGKNVAGLGAQGEQMAGMPPIWNSYVNVDDADTIVKKAEAAGGTIMVPAMDAMTAGRMAVFADPTGAVICVWQARDHIGADVTNENDTYSWNELMTRDVDAARTFYQEVFGWEFDTMDMPGGAYHVVRGGENEGLAGMMAMPDDVPDQMPNAWGVYFAVADVAAAVEKVKELGGNVLFGPEKMSVGTLATVTDAAGGAFSMMQHPTDD